MCFGKHSINIFVVIDLEDEVAEKMQLLFHKKKSFTPSMELLSICVNRNHPASREFLKFAVDTIPAIISSSKLLLFANNNKIKFDELESRSNRLNLKISIPSTFADSIENIRKLIATTIISNFRFKDFKLSKKTSNRTKGDDEYTCRNIDAWEGSPLYGISKHKSEFYIPVGWDNDVKPDSQDRFYDNQTEKLAEIYELECGNFKKEIEFDEKPIKMLVHNEKNKINIYTI